MSNGSIPVLQVRGRTLADAWENSMLELYEHGTRVRTQYDEKDKDGNWVDPPSIDCTMTTIIEEPLSEPMIHKAFPGGPEDLEEYRQEVCDGIKDRWVRDPNDHEDKRWDYTYHDRLTKYQVECDAAITECGSTAPLFVLDQLELMCQQLAKSPYTRRAKAITWQPWRDATSSEPPCLCEYWCRILEDDAGLWRLNMNVVFRSRDAYDAAFMNMFAFIWHMRKIADRVQEIAGREVGLGRYVDLSHSYHIYGKRLHGKVPNFVDGFMKMYENRAFYDDDDPHNSRTARYEDWLPMMEEARPAIAEKVAAHIPSK